MAEARNESYGQQGLTLVDRLGVYLSVRPVTKVIARYPNARVLDIGCGYHGRLLQGLAPQLASGVGVDVAISPALRSHPQLQFVEQPVEEAMATLAAVERFDVVMMVSVLEHLWEPLAVLSTCRGLLKPGGSLIVNVPTWLGKTFLEFSAFRLGTSPAIEMNDHKMYYDKRDLWPLLVKAGFVPQHMALRYHKFGLNLFAVASLDTSSRCRPRCRLP